MIKFLFFIVIIYLIGSGNFSIIISKFKKKDIRKFGSFNAGLTNIYREFGKKISFLIFILDMLKIFIVYYISYLLFGNIGINFSIFALIIGHIYPMFFQFNGGKGVFLFSIWLLIFNIKLFIIMLLIFCIMIKKTKYVSLSIISIGIFLFFYFSINYSLFYFFDLILFLINYILIMHLVNIKRLINKKENTVLKKI